MSASDHRIWADRIAGVILTVGVTCFLVWAACQWPERNWRSTDLPAGDAPDRERLAYERLLSIARAQEEYIRADWNEDGKKEYAAFLPHLWQSVSERDSSVRPVDLIDRRLAYSDSYPLGLDGYRYGILRNRDHLARGESGGATEERDPIDFSAQWAAAALPVLCKDPDSGVERPAGRLALLIRSDGAVFAAVADGVRLKNLPAAPEDLGWHPVRNGADLDRVASEKTPR